jgi:hypothetical protein
VLTRAANSQVTAYSFTHLVDLQSHPYKHLLFDFSFGLFSNFHLALSHSLPKCLAVPHLHDIFSYTNPSLISSHSVHKTRIVHCLRFCIKILRLFAVSCYKNSNSNRRRQHTNRPPREMLQLQRVYVSTPDAASTTTLITDYDRS